MNAATLTSNDTEWAAAYEQQPSRLEIRESGVAWSSDSHTSDLARSNLSSWRGRLNALEDLSGAYAQLSEHWGSVYAPRSANPITRFPMSIQPGVGDTATGLIVLWWSGVVEAEQEEKVAELFRMNATATCLASLPTDVAGFLRDHGISDEFHRFADLAASAFEIRGCSASLQSHPEEDGVQWVELEVAVTGETDRVLRQYDEFISSTSANVTANALRFFRLSLDIQ